jgi:nitroreductase
VFWREAWKYGERAFRYCQLDTGHALAAIRYASALLGWSAELVPVSDDILEQLLGLNRGQDFGTAEREHPDLLLRIVPAASASTDSTDIEHLVRFSDQGSWSGNANILDQKHLYEWPIIDEVAQATRGSETPPFARWSPADLPPPLRCKTQLQATEIIQRRRSAQAFDGISSIDAEDFFRILDILMPRSATPPLDVIPWQPRVHLVLFVHRINGLEPGLYVSLRNDEVLDSIRPALTGKMAWQRIEAAPHHLNLYRLVKANAQKAAGTLSCHQRIAADSAFSLGMLSEFDEALSEGPWAYKHLYWEAGLLGQALYLEAEAIDLQGTGIGCYFDDAFHEMLGIKDTQFQSVYHFTVGGALNDSRLRTIMPYEHIKRS